MHELSEKYNINIGTSRITRAWIKLYGETHFFDNLFANNKKDICGFHMYEAVISKIMYNYMSIIQRFAILIFLL